MLPKMGMLLNLQVALSIFISHDLSSASTTVDKLLKLISLLLLISFLVSPYLTACHTFCYNFCPHCTPFKCYDLSLFSGVGTLFFWVILCPRVQQVQNWVIIFPLRQPSPLVLHIIIRATRTETTDTP